VNVPVKFEVPEIIAIGQVLGGVANPQSLGRGSLPYGVGDDTVRKSAGESI